MADIVESTETPRSQVGGWAASLIFGEHFIVHVQGSSVVQERMEILAIQEALRYTHNVEIRTRWANKEVRQSLRLSDIIF